MQKSQKAVTEFMRLYGQALPEAPTIPDEDIRLMRVNSLAEEVGELAQASGVILEMSAHPEHARPSVRVTIDPDAIPQIDQVADALADCQYFVDGTANAYGLDLEPFFDEVHRANMSKLWMIDELKHMAPGWSASPVVVTCSNELPPVKQDSNCPVPVRQMFIVKRQDGKVMKPPGFVAPNLKGEMATQKCRHDWVPSKDTPFDPTGSAHP
ncbi:MAG: hypothetical protein ACOYB3_00150 [Azonexus sp.]